MKADLKLHGTTLILLLVPVLVLWCSSASAAKPTCGDNKCSGGETATSCPLDCGVPPPPAVCGNNVCEATESCSSCSADCGVCPPPAGCNNDGICNAGENCNNCSDCPGKTDGKPSTRYCCGLNSCSTTQCGANACTPVPVCGNLLLDYNEECDDGNLNSGDGCDAFCKTEVLQTSVPLNQFNIGDSIGEGEAANGTIGSINHQTVWSTGYNGSDSVNSLNERFEATDAAAYYENNSSRDATFNNAISGSVMADFAPQAQAVAASMAGTPQGTAGLVTVLLGNNDVCADTMAGMTNPATFEAQYRAGLDVLANSPFTSTLNLQVASIPDIYWLWNAKRTNFICSAVIWPFVPCQNLLANSGDDCASSASREDPDTIYPGDGANCQRRKAFHAAIRDTYNPILEDVLSEYQGNGKLQNAEFVDVFDLRFDSQHVNNGDCFHPSTAGHALLAEKQWCRSKYGADDPGCTP